MYKNTHKINKSRGFSIVELMISAFIGLILVKGLISVFDTTSGMNRTQNGLARIQENGRYALVQMKQNIEQAGYQYCLGSTVERVKNTEVVNTQPLEVFTEEFTDGMPTRSEVSQSVGPDAAPSPYLIDPAYMIHGHECSGSACNPSLTSIGSATAFNIPSVGNGNGDRIENTDVLTFRYYSGVGRDVESVTTQSSSGPNPGQIDIVFTQRSIDIATLDGLTPTPINEKVILAACEGTSKVVSLSASSLSSATAQGHADFPIGITANMRGKMFSVDGALSTLSYYVGNNIVDGRDIPTLYSVLNGVSNAIVQGVDRFDVLYAVDTSPDGNILILDAQGVQDLPVGSCLGEPKSGQITLNNIAGCGWRSVVSIEIHLLLNTIYNSSTQDDEPFFYSQDGNTSQSPSDLVSGINHYKMFRREFMTSIALKNF